VTRFLSVLLLLGVLTGCTGSDDDAGPDKVSPDKVSPDKVSPAEPSPTTSTTVEQRTATPAPRPATGRCYALTYDEALAATSSEKPVSCRRKHTSQTFFVGALDTVVGGHLLAVDSERVKHQLATQCPARFAAYVGGSVEARRLSMLATIPFSPTLVQSDDGQSWFRCDVIALAEPGRLAPLTGPTARVLDSEAGRARWARCATGLLGTKGSHHVLCSTNDAWRAVATIDIASGKGGSWPGDRAVQAAGDRCEDEVRDRATDKLSFTWGYEPPTKAQWTSGQHYGFCWAPGS
jgi:hypothetical protein